MIMIVGGAVGVVREIAEVGLAIEVTETRIMKETGIGVVIEAPKASIGIAIAMRRTTESVDASVMKKTTTSPMHETRTTAPRGRDPMKRMK